MSASYLNKQHILTKSWLNHLWESWFYTFSGDVILSDLSNLDCGLKQFSVWYPWDIKGELNPKIDFSSFELLGILEQYMKFFWVVSRAVQKNLMF